MKITALLATLALCLFLLGAAPPCGAQVAPVPHSEYLLTSNDSTSAPTLAMAGEPPADSSGPAPQGGTTPAATASDGTGNDNQWHLSVSPYLWFPGVHGTIGALGRSAGFKASPSDLLSHFRFGIMGAVEARRSRFLVPIDMMWIRLQADKGLPFPPALMATSATVKATEFILTPKIGFRLIDEKMIKVDALAGIRYWYFGESLSFSPPILVSGLNFSKSQNWVDPVVGGRITAALAPKLGFTMGGDVGGWGTGSQLEYQVFGLLGYKVKPAMTLQAGYRYLYVDYEKGGPAGAFVKVATSGVVLGVTLNLK
jgi:hypothetical protein